MDEVDIDDFNEEELNQLKKENFIEEQEALIDDNDIGNDQDQEPDQDDQDSDEDSNNDKRFPVEEPTNWIHWFCKLRGNEYFAEIDDEFIKNDENLVGIKIKDHIKTLLSEKPRDSTLTRELIEELQDIREIYGLIHKRFIYTPLGMGIMREKFLDGIFGYCPRILCNKQVLLPVGLSEDVRYNQVKMFCPQCQEVYKPRDLFYGYGNGGKIYKFDLPDGIYFGTSFPQAFLMNFPDLDPRRNDNQRYIPKLYGFRIFGKYGSKYYTENQEELDKKLVEIGVKSN